MDAKIIELAEKIYAENISFYRPDPEPVVTVDNKYKYDENNKIIMKSEACMLEIELNRQAQESITAAQVFYEVKREVDK